MKKILNILLVIVYFITIMFSFSIDEIDAYSNGSITLSVGSTGKTNIKLTALTSPSVNSVSWSSSNKNVAVVSGGTVTAKGRGTAIITASFNYSGVTYSASKKITVNQGTSYGSWSSWGANAISASSTREVQTQKRYRYYYYYCPVCGGREPLQGKSDCGRYTLSSSNWKEGWFTTSYASCSSATYSYATYKRYTKSLGDGKIWNFSNGNLRSTAVGTKDSNSDAVVIKNFYRSRSVSKYYYIASTGLTNITSASLSSSAYTWNGSAQRPAVTVKSGNMILNSSNYAVTYSNNTNPGVACVKVKGTGNYTGTITRTFIINKKSIKGFTVSLSKKTYTYNGKKRNPTIKVKNGNKELIQGTDYKVSYNNNVNAGTAKVIVSGLGKYSGTIEIKYNINKKAQSISVKKKQTGAKTLALNASTNGGGKLTYKCSNKKIATVSSSGSVKFKKKGKVTITITASATNNYKKSTKKVSVKAS